MCAPSDALKTAYSGHAGWPQHPGEGERDVCRRRLRSTTPATPIPGIWPDSSGSACASPAKLPDPCLEVVARPERRDAHVRGSARDQGVLETEPAVLPTGQASWPRWAAKASIAS